LLDPSTTFAISGLAMDLVVAAPCLLETAGAAPCPAVAAVPQPAQNPLPVEGTPHLPQKTMFFCFLYKAVVDTPEKCTVLFTPHHGKANALVELGR
jgi:hypothetical protein